MTETQGGAGVDPVAEDQTDSPVAVATQPETEEVIAAAVVSSAAASELMANSLAEYARIWLRRARSGESGALPVVVGLVGLVLYFQIRNSLFLSAGNLVNLMIQAAFIMTFGMAEVFVLLLGEIDLSVGYNAAMGGVITLWLLSLTHPVPLWLAVLAGLAFSGFYSGFQGLIVSWLRLPSFVVTLAGYLAGLGLLLYFINVAAPGSGGTIRLNNSVLLDIEGGSLSPLAGWIVMAAAVAVAGAFMLVRDTRRRANNLAAPPISVTILKIALMAAVGVAVVIVGNTNRGVGLTVLRGVPWVVVLLLAVLAAWTLLLGRTRFGRYVYAIGGNAEAARRAGVNLSRVRVLAFTLCGVTAGISGIIYSSYLTSMSNNFQGGQYVLYAVAAAVIGGTSLFGGRGRMVGAVLGGLVVGVIYNGLYLLGFGPAALNIWTALVLLAAVTVDAIARRGSTAAR
ncbi:MAG TPA: ABC transporter permease [Streptosporangiaceae bacterium]|nr:ABC transporter permease [Streptosporangiaceae bacterium]